MTDRLLLLLLVERCLLLLLRAREEALIAEWRTRKAASALRQLRQRMRTAAGQEEGCCKALSTAHRVAAAARWATHHKTKGSYLSHLAVRRDLLLLLLFCCLCRGGEGSQRDTQGLLRGKLRGCVMGWRRPSTK